MNVIEITRQLGKALQEDERYIAFVTAKEQSDNDQVLQDLIGEFNLKRMNLNSEMSKSAEEKNEETVAALNQELREVYAKIMSNESMQAYNTTKDNIDKVLESINYIITMAANGEDPMTCPEEKPHSCSESGCAGCSGCH